jgi:gas vesicle protein
MEQSLTIALVGILLALILGFALGWFLRPRSSSAESNEEAVVLRTQVEMLQQQLEAQTSSQEAENKILVALGPVTSKLNDMQRTVADLEKQRSDQHGQISEQLRSALQSDELLRAYHRGPGFRASLQQHARQMG